MSNLKDDEIELFHKKLIDELRVDQLTAEDGGIQEELFTQLAVEYLIEAGETENFMLAHHEGYNKSKHKINGYAEPDNLETLDLFVTILNGNIQKVSTADVASAANKAINFFKKSQNKKFLEELEVSSLIWDFANTLLSSQELKENLIRVNVIVLTDGLYKGSTPSKTIINNVTAFVRVIDIEYLYNISEKQRLPIEFNLEASGYRVPCITTLEVNNDYSSYLAIVPGKALVEMYEKYGSRLLEQNIRSFLMFSGKINKGIRKTILDEPHMFLPFNNGLSTIADNVELLNQEDGTIVITKLTGFQIVNGGQTTASLYHTFKKDRVSLINVFVQMKLTLVKNQDRFSEIISKISEFSNTQNRVSVADLSSNRQFHIDLEKISRDTYAPNTTGNEILSKWFYERARGQYKNSRLKEGTTKSKQKAFDLTNPKQQVFSKEDLAKYVNSYGETIKEEKVVIGPHMVARGNQKNYIQFISQLTTTTPDLKYFESIIAKAIIFKTSEKIYGVKPNSIGDLRYITVPYSIAYLVYKAGAKIKLDKVWKAQALSENFKSLLFELMVQVEKSIKKSAVSRHGSLYSEWARKEDCWTELKKQNIVIDLDGLRKGY